MALDGEWESQISNLRIWLFISTESAAWFFWNDFRNVFPLLHFLICDMLLLKREWIGQEVLVLAENVVNKAATIFLSWVVSERKE